MPTYDHIERYREELDRLIVFGGSDNEQSIRPAFQNCLDAYCREHRERLMLVPELRAANNVIPDGTVKDSLRMPRGYWEAKDTRDDLDTEIQRKFNRGYPRDNIIVEDSQTAVLIQNREEAMRADMTKPGELHRLIRSFLDYELPQIEEFRQAQHQFKADLPSVIGNLREAVEQAEAHSADYRETAAEFLDLCRQSISPAVTEDDVREMLLQHILTKDIFLRVFAEDQFHRENNIAQRLDALEGTFFTGDVRREAIDRLRSYYGVIGRAADEIADYAEKQGFLKAVYEDFYKAYNPAAADRLGVVYTPNEVVDFMIRGTDHLLRKHFGRGLADDNVQILDPATGTGTFITNLIEYLPDDRLEHKYLNEMHANEVAILPYYIANLNIEYTYREKTGQYLEFPNLCFVDTLDNMDWQGSTGGAVTRQSGFNLGGLSVDNWMRIQEQNEKTISVIIGNPPYNANQQNENDNNKNREYPAIDARISETYIKESTAQKTKQYDMYKRFIRWASDRLADDGIIAFITNRAYLDTRQDDGFRRLATQEFSDIYIMDLGSDVRRNPKISGTKHNVFGIQTGVSIGFFVRKKDRVGECRIGYARRDDAETAVDKLAYLRSATLDDVKFDSITPDNRDNWLNQSNEDFWKLVPLAERRTKSAKVAGEGQAIFRLTALGVNTARDEWVYDFSVQDLRNKALFFADTYNQFLDNGSEPNDPIIKWSRDLRNEFQRARHIIYSESARISSLYRPFVVKHHIANFTMNDVLTRNHYEMFGPDLRHQNAIINFCRNGRHFYTLAASKLTDWHFTGDTQCLPLYRYTEDGERVCNITEWGLRRFREHYGERGGGITAEKIFAYTYAILHDPVYREKYAVDLLREFPRLPLYDDFDLWADMGQELLKLHVGFESAEPYELERRDSNREAGKPRLRADKERGVIILDERTTLAAVPSEAWEYRLGSRSALEWVLDQYKEKKPRDPTIRERFNTYRFADHKEKVIDLLQRVCTVSVRTVEIVEGMRRLGR
ncbi:MAG: N-6 DNA methylase [Chloroflexota bacterium]|nr:N-6 DNA methylase [Chloroflexota bacterium]